MSPLVMRRLPATSMLTMRRPRAFSTSLGAKRGALTERPRGPGAVSAGAAGTSGSAAGGGAPGCPGSAGGAGSAPGTGGAAGAGAAAGFGGGFGAGFAAGFGAGWGAAPGGTG